MLKQHFRTMLQYLSMELLLNFSEAIIMVFNFCVGLISYLARMHLNNKVVI